MLKNIKILKLYRFAIFIYLLVNSLFVLKYGERQHYISAYLLVVIYNIFILGLLYVISKISYSLNIFKKSNFFLFSVFIFCIFFVINLIVDGNTLNTDRWSAMKTTIEGVLSGIYPYNLKDHLGQTSSNLPGLFYIGLPFYLIGNIGMLQVFTFILGSFILYKSKLNVKDKITILVLFLCSPAYLWEIFAKSDLVSNILLLIYFMFYWHKKYRNNYFKNISLLAFACSFLFLTRGIVVIPLTLFLFSDFLKLSATKKMVFLGYNLVFLVLISLPILFVLPDFKTIIEHNPFNHQTRFTPFWMQLLFVLLPFLVYVKNKSFYQVTHQSFINFTFLLLISFLIEVLDENFNDALYKSYFDISYLTMILPFAILIIASKKEFTSSFSLRP